MILSPSVTFLRTQSDERLVELVRKGSEAAFSALVERHRGTMGRACGRIVAPSRVDDVVQQALLAAWQAIRRGDEVRNLRHWLLRITRNTALNALRTPGYDHHELIDSLQGGDAPQAVLERRETIRATLTGVAALPEHQRVALLRSAIDGTTQREIAEDLGVSEGAVRQLVLRARCAMRGAATALVPAPAMEWLALAGQRGHPGVSRAAELAAGAAPVSAAGIAKLGAATIMVTGATLAPAIVPARDATREHTAAANAKARRATPAPTRAGVERSIQDVNSGTARFGDERPGSTPVASRRRGRDPERDRTADRHHGRDDARGEFDSERLQRGEREDGSGTEARSGDRGHFEERERTRDEGGQPQAEDDGSDEGLDGKWTHAGPEPARAGDSGSSDHHGDSPDSVPASDSLED